VATKLCGAIARSSQPGTGTGASDPSGPVNDIRARTAAVSAERPESE
jgi:hypothetical protein